MPRNKRKKLDKEKIREELEDLTAEEALENRIDEYYSLKEKVAEFERIKKEIKFISDGSEFKIKGTRIATRYQKSYSMPLHPDDRKAIYDYFVEKYKLAGFLELIKLDIQAYRSLPKHLMDKLQTKISKVIEIEDADLQKSRNRYK